MYRFPITIDKTKVQSVNNSTSFIDVSGKVWTAAGNAKLSTGDYEFAPASGVFDGNGDYISTPSHTDFNMTVSDCTIDFWFKANSFTNGYPFYTTSDTPNPTYDNNTMIYPYSDGRIGIGKQGLNEIASAAGTITTGVWTHVAVTRTQATGVTKIYVNGVEKASNTTAVWSNSSKSTYIGGMPTVRFFNGMIDEFRISKDIVRWTSDFSVPTARHTLDSYTKVLLHFGDDITNFPFLFNEGCSSIPSGFWSHVVDTVSGLDIRFFDTDGVAELKREIVLYNSGTSKVEVWVQIPSLGTASNKIIYCQYGGATRASDYDLWNVFTPKGIYHLQSLSDSSTQSVNLTNVGASSTTGKIENGYNFDGSHYVYRTDTDDKQDITGSFTMSVWVNPTSLPSIVGTIIAKRLNGSGTHNYIFDVTSTGNVIIYNNGLTPGSLTSTTTISTGIWSYVAAVYNGSTVKLYINGIERGSQSVTGAPVADSGPFGIGADYPGSWTDFFSGKIDEARVFASAFSADWIKTEYNNQNDPSTFSLCSAEEDVTRVYKFPITIDKTKVQGTNTNFVYLFSELCSSIPAGFWAHVKDSGGLDIIFFDTDGVTELKREIVLYSTGTNKVEAWVQILSLGTASNKIIYCQYGGATRANDSTLWSDAEVVSTFHYQGNANDSGDSNNGTVTGAVQNDGKIQKCYSFDGTGNKIASAHNANLIPANISLSAWVYCRSFVGATGGYMCVVNKGHDDGLHGYDFEVKENGTKFNVAWYMAHNGDYSTPLSSTNTYDKNAWYHLAVTFDGTDEKIFVNGTSDGTRTDALSSTQNTGNFTVGRFATDGVGLNRYFDGLIEEVRAYNVAKTTDWFKTEYNNQNDPATFSSCGAESSVIGEEIFTVWIPGII